MLARWASPQLPPRLTVAFSGGLDSTVLLAALCRLELPARVRAVHVDHGLHPQSAAWSAHCASTAAALGAEFVAARVAVDLTAGQGLEAAARDARYRVLGELLAPGEWLLTAHHGDDQLETLLLRLLRGTGVRGLRGIIAFGPFAGGSLGRPLLGFTREQLRAQALAWKLAWLEDPSNQEPRHDRNYLRLHVLPALLARWPSAVQHAERLAEQMSEAEQLLDAVAAEDARALAAPWHVPRAALAALAAGAAAQSVAVLAARRRRRHSECAQGRGAACCAARSARGLACARALAERRRPRISRGPVSRSAAAAELAARLSGAHRLRGGWTGPEGRLAFVPAAMPTACPSRGSPRG